MLTNNNGDSASSSSLSKTHQKTLILTTSDGKSIQVESLIFQASGFIQNMIQDLSDNSDDSDTWTISLPNINSMILQKIIEFCQHHQNDPPFTEEMERKFRRQINMDHWDEQFCKIDQKTLFDLMMAANFLNLKFLLEVTCKAVANLIRGKTPQEIRSTFNIENDFTPEEEEAIRQENKWCLDN